MAKCPGCQGDMSPFASKHSCGWTLPKPARPRSTTSEFLGPTTFGSETIKKMRAMLVKVPKQRERQPGEDDE